MSRAGAPSQRAKDRAAQAMMDEAADAVRRRVAEQGSVCDFCAAPLGAFVAWIVDAPIMGTLSMLDEQLGTGTAAFIDSPEWYACLACDPVVAAGDAEALTEHVLATSAVRDEVPAAMQAAVRADFLDLYRVFYALNPRRER